jgi:hypothetical protein
MLFALIFQGKEVFMQKYGVVNINKIFICP